MNTNPGTSPVCLHVMPSLRPLIRRIARCWRRFWLSRSGTNATGRVAAWLASCHLAPYHQASCLADQRPEGFAAAGARIIHEDLRLGKHVYLGDRVMVYSTSRGGPVIMDDNVHIYGNAFIETAMGGSIHIRSGTHIQPDCHIHAYLGRILIGSKVEIAPACGFYCYDHGTKAGIPIMDQPLYTKGDITIGDGAWIGHGVTILQGVSIGDGAVVAAGSVVTRDIPANAVAAGVPAKVMKYRGEDPFN